MPVFQSELMRELLTRSEPPIVEVALGLTTVRMLLMSAEPCTEKSVDGVEVPMPTLPLLSTTKEVKPAFEALDDVAIDKSGRDKLMVDVPTDRYAQGVDEPTPRRPFKLSHEVELAPPNAPPLLYWSCVVTPPGLPAPPAEDVSSAQLTRPVESVVSLPPLALPEQLKLDSLSPPVMSRPFEEERPAVEIPPTKVEVAEVVAKI